MSTSASTTTAGRLRFHRSACGPAVLTVGKGEFEPRLPSLKGIMAAKRKPLEERDVDGDGSVRLVVDLLEEPQPRPEGRVVGEGAGAVPELTRLLREEAKVL